MRSIARLYQLFAKVTDWLQPIVLLVFRLTWGWQFFITGKGKLVHHSDITDFFTSLHIPAPGLNAWFVGGAECFGGLLLLLGLASKPTGFLLAIVMSVAYLSVAEDRAKVFNIFKDSTPFLTADPFFFWLTAIIILAFGPGLISVDALIAALWKKQLQSREQSSSKTTAQS